MAKRKTKSERARLTDELDKLCLEIVRLRDENRCQKCGKEIEGSNSHPCHVVPKGKGASKRRFDLLNIFLGDICHHQWWHLNPLDANDWFKEKFPARYAYLEIYRGGKAAKISTEEMRNAVEIYKQKLQELKGELK